MSLKRTIYCLLLLLVSVSRIGAQDAAVQPMLENILEALAADADEDFDYMDAVEDLTYFAAHPLNLNEADFDDLSKLWVLSDFQIKSLLDYRRSSRGIVSLYELALIDGFDYSTVQQILPFIQLSGNQRKEVLPLSKALRYAKQEVYLRSTMVLQNAEGYLPAADSSDTRYLGNKASLYTRYQMRYKKQLYLGVTMEKDPGEDFFTGSNRAGFDFYSLHFQVKDLGLVQNVVLGDYSAQFGQGLVLWSAFPTGKSVYVMQVRKNAAGLRKYSSTNENMFFRGAGLTLGTESLQLTTFASYKAIDANIKSDTTVWESGYFSTLEGDGIHATQAEVEDKDAVQEAVVGANLNWKHEIFQVGLSGLAYRYSHPLIKQETLRNLYAFQGTENYNLGADFQCMFRGVHLFGELALSQNQGHAYLIGALLRLHENLNASFVYRDYAKDYQALYAGGFGETDQTCNERGWYLGATLNPVKKVKLSAYYDFFRFPWLRTSVDAPSQGYAYLVQADFVATRDVNMYLRYQYKSRQKNSDADLADKGIPSLSDETKGTLRYQINYQLSKSWELRNRIEFSTYYHADKGYAKGFMAYQDVLCSPFKFPLSLAFRYAIFDTDSYDARMYAYENDLLYSYSILPYYETGCRSYLMFKYKLADRVDFWLRFSHTWYQDKESIGSALNEIAGNQKSDVKFQARIKF